MAIPSKYEIKIFDDLKDEYNKAKVLLDEKKFPIYLMLTNYHEDSICVSDRFSENLKLGTVKLNYDKQVFEIQTDTRIPCAAGQFATVLLNTLKYYDDEEESMFKKQTGVIFNNTEDGPKFQLIIAFNTLGGLIEEFYSVYFTGKTIMDIENKDFLEVGVDA